MLTVASQRAVSLMSLDYELKQLRAVQTRGQKNNGASSHRVIMVMLSNVLTESKHVS